MVKRIIMICLCFVFTMLPFSFIAAADIVNINTPLHEPEPIYEVLSDHIHITFYWVQNVSNNDLLYEIEANYPLGTNMYFMKSGVGMFRTDQLPLEITQYTYSLSDGSLNSIGNDPMANYQSTVDGITYKYFKWVHMNQGSFYYPDNSSIKIDIPLYDQKYNITWAPDLPFVHTYKSFVSEPVSDELNRYFVLAGEEEQYLYCIRYFLSEAVAIQIEYDIDPNNSYQYALRNLFCPYIDMNNNGLQLSIACDADLIELINQGSNNAAIAYDIQVSQYNLQDGEYISSYVFTDILLVNDSIPLNINFGDHTRFDSIQVWGVMYQDTSTTYHYNLLNCTWALDPDFIAWQDQVSNYLNLIYQALTESEETVTINDDMSAYDEMQSAKDDLIVTDAYGEPVDAAEQVEVAFSGAAEGIGEIAEGVSSVNGLITDIINVHPLVIVPLIVGLALGLLVTMLGKDKSD